MVAPLVSQRCHSIYRNGFTLSLSMNRGLGALGRSGCSVFKSLSSASEDDHPSPALMLRAGGFLVASSGVHPRGEPAGDHTDDVVHRRARLALQPRREQLTEATDEQQRTDFILRVRQRSLPE